MSSGDVSRTLLQGAAHAHPGHIWLLDVTAREARQVPVEGWPGGVFQPHGIFFSNATGRFYAVNHPQMSKAAQKTEWRNSQVEIFDVLDGPVLRHRLSVRSDAWGPRQLNDVVEGSLDGSDFYVTRFHQMNDPGPVEELKYLFKSFEHY